MIFLVKNILETFQQGKIAVEKGGKKEDRCGMFSEFMEPLNLFQSLQVM